VYRDLVLEAVLRVPHGENNTSIDFSPRAFGGTLAVSNDTIVVGLAAENKVYVFAWNGTDYILQPVEIRTPFKINVPTNEGGEFGALITTGWRWVHPLLAA